MPDPTHTDARIDLLIARALARLALGSAKAAAKALKDTAKAATETNGGAR